MAVRSPVGAAECSVDDGRTVEFLPRIRPVWNDMYRPSAWKSSFVKLPNILMALDWHKHLKSRRRLAVATTEASNTLVRRARPVRDWQLPMPAYSRCISP